MTILTAKHYPTKKLLTGPTERSEKLGSLTTEKQFECDDSKTRKKQALAANIAKVRKLVLISTRNWSQSTAMIFNFSVTQP